MKPITTIDDPRYVKAMSHPLRVRLLAMLHEQRASPTELADRLGASLGTVAYHVRTLHNLGLIDLVGETRKRGAIEHHYKAKERPRVSDDAWGRASPIAKQAAVSSSLQIIHEYASASAAAGGFDRADSHLTRTVMCLDEAGRQELAKACLGLLRQISQIEEDAADRIRGHPHVGNLSNIAAVLMVFDTVRLSDQPPPGQASVRDGTHAEHP